MAIQIRRGTDANFNANSGSIVEGEPIITTDTERFAVGVSNGTFAEFTNTEVLASEFDQTQSYTEGDYCTHNGKLYQCLNFDGGSWNADNWNLVTVMETITQLETTVDALGNVANLTYTVVSTF